MPHSIDREYSERAIPQYERAVEQAGGEPIRIPLDRTPTEVAKINARCDGVILPGSNVDLDPARYNAPRSPHTASADPRRDSVDELLLQDAYNLRKPVLGICYGLQNINVTAGGSLIQHIPDSLPPDFQNEGLLTRVDHEAGRKLAFAHTIEIERDSKLAEIVGRKDREGHGSSSQPALSKQSTPKGTNGDAGKDRALAVELSNPIIPVNSSHHQSANIIGKGLRITARCPDDGIIEALEGIDPNHFVLAVQWHPERSIDDDEPSRAIFRALIKAAENRVK
jgi:putative glutamine amidotransferase